MQNKSSIVTYGFAIFIMFFGSGNLVFPLEIGLASGGNWLSAFFGLFITGILLPLLGLFVIKIHKGSYEDFFAEAGSLAKVVLPLFILSLLGSFGVVPRCITVAHGGIEHMMPSLSLAIFSFLFCVACFFMCLKDHLMVSMLGKWMTPVLLASLALLIGVAVLNAPALEPVAIKKMTSFKFGFKTGYETMDLFAAFFFSSLIFKQMQSAMPASTKHKELIMTALKSSFIGALLLSLAYLGFVYLGAYYSGVIASVTPELILPTIAMHVLGDKAALLIGVIFVLSCLTTAVALSNIYARYLCSLMGLEGDRWFMVVLFITMVASFFVSLLDFKGIAGFLGPILDVSYPSLIALTFMSTALRGMRWLKITVFYAVMVFMLV